jgi:raffinose/stachyose/melibiose transport system substrate-binding protein
MKKIILITILVCACLNTNIFAAGTKEAGMSEGKTTIKMWTWRPEDIDFYNSVIADFEAENPTIQVEQNAMKNTEYNTVLAASLAGGSGPDIFMGRAYGGLLTYVESGYLEPITNMFPEVANYPSAALGGASDGDGNIWGLPAVGQTLCVYYNKAMFKEYGLEVPQTWNEFLNVCKTLKANGEIPIANGTKDGWCVETLLGVVAPAFYGPDYFDEVIAGDANFEDPRFINALNHMKQLTPYLPNLYTGIGYTDMQSYFINEMAGMFLGGSYEKGNFVAQNPDLDYGVFAIPGDKASDPKLVTVYADMNWAVNAAGENKEATAKFVQFLGSKHVGQKVIDELQMVSWVPGTNADSNPFIGEILELQKESTPYIFLVGFRYQQPTGSSLWQAAGQAFMSGDYTAMEAAMTVQKGIATYYKPFQK